MPCWLSLLLISSGWRFLLLSSTYFLLCNVTLYADFVYVYLYSKENASLQPKWLLPAIKPHLLCTWAKSTIKWIESHFPPTPFYTLHMARSHRNCSCYRVKPTVCGCHCVQSGYFTQIKVEEIRTFWRVSNFFVYTVIVTTAWNEGSKLCECTK